MFPCSCVQSQKGNQKNVIMENLSNFSKLFAIGTILYKTAHI